MVLAVVRIRGTVHRSSKVRDTLRMLRLERLNTLALVPEDPSHKGMIDRVKDFVTYGEVDPSTLEILLRKRGRIEGDRPLTDEFVREATKGAYPDLSSFARALAEGRARLSDLGPKIKPFFRLPPARGGLEGIKRSFKSGGSLGYRGKEINDLIRRMVPKEE